MILELRPKDAHEMAARQVGGLFNLSYTCRDRKNYLRTKRQRELAFGQAGSMLKYFHDKIAEKGGEVKKFKKEEKLA